MAASARPLSADRATEARLNERRASEGRPPACGDRPAEREPGVACDPKIDTPRAGPAGEAPLRPVGARPVSPARVRGATSLSLARPEAGPVGRPEAGLDRRTAERLRKGTRAPDARIDLHGMTAERAHRACLRFLGEAIGCGHRVVLVITGKGGRGEAGRDAVPSRGRGVLRDSLPGWLRASPLGASIVGIYEAHRRHGGEGAFYVYLKRLR